ncbi:hypothetical protein [Pseudomonas brenneri]
MRRHVGYFCVGVYKLSNSCLASQLESTVRYLGIEVDEALEMAEQTEV